MEEKRTCRKRAFLPVLQLSFRISLAVAFCGQRRRGQRSGAESCKRSIRTKDKQTAPSSLQPRRLGLRHLWVRWERLGHRQPVSGGDTRQRAEFVSTSAEAKVQVQAPDPWQGLHCWCQGTEARPVTCPPAADVSSGAPECRGPRAPSGCSCTGILGHPAGLTGCPPAHAACFV